MRFLHISNFFPVADSGAAGTIMSLTSALNARGHKLDLVWCDEKPFRLSPNFSRFIELPARQLAQARSALARTHYDVLVVHQPHGYPIFTELAPKYPNTLFLNFSHGWELADVGQLEPGARQGLARRAKDYLASRLVRAHCSRAARFAQGIVVLNRGDAAFLRNHHNVPEHFAAVISPGLDPALVGVPPRAAAPQGAPPRLLFVGNYIYMKGTDMLEASLLDAARAGADFRFTCVTHADRHEAIRARLGPALGARLSMEPWQSRATLIELIRAHDVLLFPSRYEGFGKIAHEAMACGLAVVGGRVGALADCAAHGQNALLSEPGDYAAFNANVRKILAEPGLAARLGEAARVSVREDTWERSAILMEEFVADCRARRGLAPCV